MNAFFEAGCNFALGLARCDNRIAYLFSETNMAKTLNLRMANVPFHIHGIEVQRTERIGTMYHTKAAVMGDGSPLLLADQLPF